MTSVKEWIEKKIKNEYIRYFEYDKFSQITEIDRGGFGQVSKANLANAGLVALKIFFSNNSNIEEDELNEANDGFIKELKLLREVDYHQNINRILGITKDSKHYILVLEYANEGNLRNYLKKNFTSLKWNNKIQMALDITSGLKFLHSKEVIHRDLHSKNILVNNGKLLIADFGLSKKLAEITPNSKGNKYGMVEYIEPQCLKNIEYKKDKKSDIYSLGVLLWEISSGRPPFSKCSRGIISCHIKDGYREKPIENTPPKYQKLYQECWDGEPEPRPDIEKVYEILSQLKTSFDLQSQYNEDKNNSKTDDDDLIIPSNYQIINSRNENGKPSQLKTGSFDLQSPHLNIPNNDNRSNSKALLTIPSDSQNLNSRNEKKKKGNPRNLLIIGHAGSGKSTLSNVLSNTVDFEESECSKNFRKQIFEWEGIKYHVVDDIGMALTNKEVMYEKMSEVNYLIPEGISQILFVIDGKFTAEEENTFNLLEDSIFGNDIAEYITIVRTKFSNFKNEIECKKDKDELYNENEIVAKLCKSIIHIDNPPINIFVHDEDDRETIIINKRRRDQSRTILLDHLNKVISEKYYDIIYVGNIIENLNRSLNLKNPKFNFNNLKVGFRNLIIVGRTNSGKSTLAEVLSDSHYYEESVGKIEKKYNVIDVGVTKPIKNIIKLSEKIKEICQILFVIDGKITADEVEAIFGNDIHEHITIVRTKFSNFKNEDKCKKDKEDLCKQNEAVAKIRQNIVYVDNPPININVKDKDDEATITLSRKRRGWSRTILLDHLNKVFGEKYKSIYLDGTTSSKKRNEENYTPKLMKRLTSFINLNSARFKLNPNKLEREKIRNLLIIGRTGSGKSALSDVLCGTYDLSNTVKKNFQQKSFEWKGTKYRLIEIRIKLIERKVLFNKIREIIYSMPEGISQVLFVIDRRFTAEEIETFKVFDKVILESGIIEHTTIIRTKFANFEKKNECERDKKELCRENEIISKMVGSCRGVIYVDNPPTNIQGVERREKSRTILLHHLKTACQRFYKFGTWDVLYDKIASYMNMKESEMTSTVEDYIAKEVVFNLISDIPALENVNFDAYHKYRIEVASRKILKDITTIDLGENIESIPDTQLTNSASLMKFWKKTELSTNETNKKIIQRFKLDHGLFLNEFIIKPGSRPIFTEDGELNIRLYNGQPIVYININDSTNLLDFNNKLQSFDVCINFLIAEITYKSELLEDFSKCNDNVENFHELYGHSFARKVSVGNKLFIKEFNSATQTQIGILKFYLLCAYNLAKYSIEIQFKNLFTLDLLPKMETLDGEELNTYEKLVKWMNNLYPQKTSDEKKLNTHTWINKLCQDNKIDIISYGNFVTTSDLRCSILSIYDSETFDENQPGIINFKEKLSLEDWVRDAEYDNLISLITDSHLFLGLIFNQSCEMKVSEEIAINLLEVPKVNVRDKSCLKIIRPSTKLEVNLISNNIFSIKDLNTFPFIEHDKEIYEDYDHVLFKCEQYEILLNKNNIKPTETFEKVIEKALNSMKPLKSLQYIFNKYGHLFPQRIILGSSLKIILQNSSSYNAIDNINLKSPIFDSLKSHLDKLNVSYLLTQKGKSIENQDLDNWIIDANDNLEIIEFGNIIPLYKILKKEQRSKIEDLLKNNYKILMTGVTNLGDLNNNNVEYYKRINIKPSLDDENYEVIGSIISENNTKLEEININFGLYDYNGFFAVIKKLEATSIDITRCYILWMIIGIPSKSSVFSPKNRKIQVNYIKESITLQPNQSCYRIKAPSLTSEGVAFLLAEGDVISVHAYYPLTNLELNSIIIKSIKWKDRSIDVQITDIISMSDIELHICVLYSYDGKLKIDNEKELEYPLDLIGCILTDGNNADVN